MKKLILLLSLLLLIATGCTTPAQRLEPQTMSLILKGQSTQPEMETAFGRPNHTVQDMESGKTVANYIRSQKKETTEGVLLGMFAKNPGDMQVRTLSILYSRGRIVEDFRYRETRTPYKLGFGTVESGRVLTPADLGRVVKGVTGRDTLEQWFGHPMIVLLRPDGGEKLVWGYYKGETVLGTRQDIQQLTIDVNPQGIVQGYVLGSSMDGGTQTISQ